MIARELQRLAEREPRFHGLAEASNVEFVFLQCVQNRPVAVTPTITTAPPQTAAAPIVAPKHKRPCLDRDQELEQFVASTERNKERYPWAWARDEYNKAHPGTLPTGRAGRNRVREGNAKDSQRKEKVGFSKSIHLSTAAIHPLSTLTAPRAPLYHASVLKRHGVNKGFSMLSIPGPPGVIEPGRLYLAKEARERLRIGPAAWRELRDGGLQVIRPRPPSLRLRR